MRIAALVLTTLMRLQSKNEINFMRKWFSMCPPCRVVPAIVSHGALWVPAAVLIRDNRGWSHTGQRTSGPHMLSIAPLRLFHSAATATH